MSASCRASASPPTARPRARTQGPCAAAAQKALALEFEARAERFGACANADIALGSDGTLRWLGAPVAALVASDDPLKPRPVLLADEQLTGPARDKVAARAERFVNYQVESLLKPLVDLKQRRRPYRHGARPRLPARREFRRAQPPRRRRGRARARPGGARLAAPAGRALRRLPRLRAGAAQAGARPGW